MGTEVMVAGTVALAGMAEALASTVVVVARGGRHDGRHGGSEGGGVGVGGHGGGTAGTMASASAGMAAAAGTLDTHTNERARIHAHT